MKEHFISGESAWRIRQTLGQLVEQVLKYFFNQRPIKKPSSETLLRLAELVLTLNCFSFGNNYYKQINGVAKGTKVGPSYANLRRLHRKQIFLQLPRTKT